MTMQSWIRCQQIFYLMDGFSIAESNAIMKITGSLWQGSSLDICITHAQQKMDHLKRAGFNVRSKQVHEQITMTKSDTELADKLLTQLVPKGAF